MNVMYDVRGLLKKETPFLNVSKDNSPNYAMEGASFMLDKIKRTPEITPNTVSKFDGHFENAINEIDAICVNCRFDIELNDGTKFEYKSYNEASINRISTSDAFLKQHLSYLENITDIKKLNYEFDIKKFSDRDEIVKQFKKMYEKNPKQIFEVNPNLFNKIKDYDGDVIEKWQDFKNYISDPRFRSDNKLFEFIKAE